MMAAIPAELRLVIAGNHDLSLDRAYVDSHKDEEDYEDDVEEHEAAWALWKGEHAKQAGVMFLEEGLHTFTLKSGVHFTVYASPKTPAFMDWADMYGPETDPFNAPDAPRPVPSTGVDIMMTHGPPSGQLGMMPNGEDLGCEELRKALERAKPKLHCFGHIHEAYGAEVVAWGKKTEKAAIDSFTLDRFVCVDGTKMEGRTVLVNAAMQDEKHKLSRPPWIVDLPLLKG